MSARQRSERWMRAVDEGRAAFKAGKPKSACPYKVSDWGAGGFWQMGWDRAATEATTNVTGDDHDSSKQV